MRARMQHLAVLVCATLSLLLVVLVSGCVLTIGDTSPATLSPPSSSATPAPASLFIDPPVPNVTGAGAVSSPAMSKPQARAPYVDPAYGTRLVRATDCGVDISPGDASPGLENDAAWAQAFNADGSWFLIHGTAGSWYLYNATTLLPEGRLPFDGLAEPRWDAASPDVLYYVDGPRFMRYDITAQEKTVVHDFSGDFSPHAPARVRAGNEHSPSEDGRSWALAAQGGMGKTFAFLIYDPIADQVVARRDITPTEEAVSVAVSPLGDYFLAFFPPLNSGRAGTDDSPGGLMIYDRNLKNGRCLLPNAGSGSDLALDAQGREVLVYHDDRNGTLSTCDLATGQRTVLFPINDSLQISGRALGVPGWALVSGGDRVLAVELKPGGRVVALAWSNSRGPSRATADRNFTRVLFASSWGRVDTGAFDTYLIVLPPGWTDRLA